jgi:hypothetical protein
MKKLMNFAAWGMLLGLVAFLAPPAAARMKEGTQNDLKKLSALGKVGVPTTNQCTHRTGRLWFTVTNYGFFGNQDNPNILRDCLTGGRSASAEFPGGTLIEYLFQGSLWIGAIVGEDTLVSTGNDGWSPSPGGRELWADAGPTGDIVRRSINKASPYFREDAVSDLDLVATMYDTLTDPSIAGPDPTDGRPNLPIGVKVIQKSYSWASGWGQDWVMLDYEIINLRNRPINKMYLGIFVDADVGHPGTPDYFADDLSGFKASVPNELFPECLQDTINLAYVFDADGDPTGTVFRSTSPTGVTGVRVVRAPGPLSDVKTSFNWWTPNAAAALDWGPQKTATARQNPSGGRGQPEGDKMKYHYLSNLEFDFDQVQSAVNQTSAGWLSPLGDIQAVDIANGYDTRYLVSFGEFPLFEGDTLKVTLGYIAGEGFHKDPSNFVSNLGFVNAFYKDTAHTNAFVRGLDFTAIAGNARWVQRVYDNENFVDTVLCNGVRVERQIGDGVPDFRGPLPPPAPETLSFVGGLGEVTIHWFGKNSETSLDSFSKVSDFEGYRIMTSTNNVDFTMVGSFDRVNWKPYFFNVAKGRWQPAPANPMSFDQIQQRYAQIIRDSLGDPNFVLDPERYNSEGGCFLAICLPRWRDTTRSSIPIRFGRDSISGRFIDTVFIFKRQDFNLGLNNARVYPDSTNDFKYWYQYKLTGLFPSQPIYVSVVPFDFGFLTPNQNIDAQEAQPTSASRLVYALPSEDQRASTGLKVSVYPNPYRVDQDYSFFEKPTGPSAAEIDRARRINFINLPATCIVRIYTVDGDLVQEIKHEKDPSASDAGFNQWDLLNRNTQPVAPGLYLYSVQPTGAFAGEKLHVGKIVIIK